MTTHMTLTPKKVNLMSSETSLSRMTSERLVALETRQEFTATRDEVTRIEEQLKQTATKTDIADLKTFITDEISQTEIKMLKRFVTLWVTIGGFLFAILSSFLNLVLGWLIRLNTLTS